MVGVGDTRMEFPLHHESESFVADASKRTDDARPMRKFFRTVSLVFGQRTNTDRLGDAFGDRKA